jgi:hypothetical protein
MASVMAIRSEVFGSCVGEIDVSVVIRDGDAWLCCGLKYLGFTLAEKAAQCLRWRWEVVPGIGWSFGAG